MKKELRGDANSAGWL